jgi:hypothetical protein
MVVLTGGPKLRGRVKRARASLRVIPGPVLVVKITGGKCTDLLAPLGGQFGCQNRAA